MKIFSQTEEKIIRKLKHRLAEVAGNRLQSVIVYGSRSGGSPTPSLTWMWLSLYVIPIPYWKPTS